jgi:hypothetical protein
MEIQFVLRGILKFEALLSWKIFFASRKCKAVRVLLIQFETPT